MTRQRDYLTGLRDLLQEATTVPGYVGALPYDVDEAWSISYTNAATDPLDRWGQGVTMLQSRGDPGDPFTADDIAEPLLAVLTRLAGVTFGAVTVTQCIPGASSRGLDSSKRSVRADRVDTYLDYQA